jgi:hypothetical protein
MELLFSDEKNPVSGRNRVLVNRKDQELRDRGDFHITMNQQIL